MEIIKDRIELLKLMPKNMIIAELGIFIGEYSEHIIDICKPKAMYMVDIFGKGHAHSMGVEVPDLSLFEDILKERYKDRNIFVLKMTDLDFLSSLEYGWMDMVYIDAEHSYQAVLKGLSYAYLKVRSGGYLCGHDYNMPEVKKAVDEFCNRFYLEIKYLTQEQPQSFVIIRE